MFGFPFSNDLVKGSASLLSDNGSSMNPLVFQLEVFQLNCESALGLLSACNLCIQSLDCFFSLRKSRVQLCLAHFKLINAACSLSFHFDFHNWISALALDKALRASDF